MNGFRLSPEAHLVVGEDGALLHDLRTGRIFRLDETYAQILELSEQNRDQEHIAATLGLQGDQVGDVWAQVARAGCGTATEGPVYIEKVNLVPEWRKRVPFKSPPPLRYAFLDLGGPCELGCSYCDGGIDTLSTPCFQCHPSVAAVPVDRRALGVAIKSLAELRVHEIVVLASPAVDVDLLRDSLQMLREHVGFIVTLASDARIADRVGAMVGELDSMRLRMSVDDCDPERWKTVHRSLRAGLIIELLVGREGLSAYEEAASRLTAEGIEVVFQSAVASTTRGVGPHMSDDRCTMETFSVRTSAHPCLSSVVTVRSDGSILTCPQLHEVVGGGFDLTRAISSPRYAELAGMSIDTIEPCRRCSYRYACHDCRAREVRAGASLAVTVTCSRGDG